MDIMTHLEVSGFVPRRTGKHAEYILQCPQCDRPKLAINTEKNVWQCFYCAQGGGIGALCKFLGIKRPKESDKDYRKLRKIYSSLDQKPQEIQVIKDVLPKEYKQFDNSGGFMQTKAKQYLNNRGISDHQIASWKLGYCATGPYMGYVIIPVYDLDGIVRTWQGRRFYGAGKKSANPYSVERYIYNLPFAQGHPGIIVVEGPFDAMVTHTTLSQELNISSVGIFGHTVTPLQARMIATLLKPTILWLALDPDIELSECHKKASLYMSEGIQDVRVCRLKSDPDETKLDEWCLILEDAEKPEFRTIHRT